MAYTTIDDPSEYFTTLLYTGNASDNRNLTNDANAGDFQPDWIWIKERSSTSSHMLHDSTRGASKAVISDTDAVEDADANRLQAIQSNGFQIGTASTVNQNTITVVAWQWKANGGTATATINESGNNPAAVVQANTDAGFSIITYTGTGAAGTIAHGLGAVPGMIIVKNRGRQKDWCVYHHRTASDPETDKIELNLSAAVSDDAAVWNDTAPTSSVFTVGPSDQRTNADADTYIAYVFAEKQGYSKFGSYEGNGNVDGTFVHLGFKPAWFMCKSIDTSSSDQGWNIFDTKRDGFNVDNDQLLANDSGAEVTTDRLDIVSNGVKMRNAGSQSNSAQTYIYLAFAESPFVSSKGVPTTAR